jgi:hypothetical protein
LTVRLESQYRLLLGLVLVLMEANLPGAVEASPERDSALLWTVLSEAYSMAGDS